MKKLILLSVGVITTNLWAQCTNKIDPNKVMLFVDTNDSGLEIITAEKAACQRGQKLVVVPKAYKEYKKYVAKQEQASKLISDCASKFSNDYQKVQQVCKNQIENFNKIMLETENFKKSQPLYKDEMKGVLDDLRKSKGTLENFTISGHDGGGHFGGMKQSFTRQDVASIMKDYQDINNVKSLMLLGCYTGVQREVIDWQTIFPDVRLIGGYDGSAPLANRPQGHNYLYDLLTKEKLLTTTADQKKLEFLVKNNIKSINELNAALFLKPVCTDPNEEKPYYYGKIGQSRLLRPFDLQECVNAKKDLLALKDRLDKYDSGELEPPKNTASGELRDIYNQSRSHEHCSEVIGDVLDSNKVFGLLFHDGVRNNFADYYDDQMKEAEKIVKDLSIEELLQSSEKGLNDYQLSLEQSEADIKLMETDTKAYRLRLEEEHKQELEAYKEKIKDPKYKSLLEKLPYLKMEENSQNFIFSGTNSALTEEEQVLMNELNTKSFQITSKKYDLQFFKESPSSYIESKKYNLTSMREDFERQKLAVTKLRVDNPMANIWIPTKNNLEGKTRQEIMVNQHAINGLLNLPFLPNKQRGALSWVNATVGARLQAFDNPFSWHEYTSTKPEAPHYDTKLSETIKLYEETGPGIYGNGGGVVGGFMGGGGYGYGAGAIGGSNSGSGHSDESPLD